MRDLPGMRVTVMGLGLHGGGAAAAEYCAKHGAEVTVTDLQDHRALQPSVDMLSGRPGIRFVLGRHEESDFLHADLVVKNPAVPRSAKYLSLARRIETDISLYLRISRSPIIGVTGTKGKSTTAAAAAHLMRSRGARVGGNITVSPLTFLDDEDGDASPTVLELSSFQLGDLLLTDVGDLPAWPRIGVLTNFMRDHQNYYHSMAAYRKDKEVLFRFQDPTDRKVLDSRADYAGGFLESGAGSLCPVSRERIDYDGPQAYLREGNGVVVDGGGREQVVFGRDLPIPGEHNRQNLLYAACVAWLYGIDTQEIRAGLSCFSGVPHRMEIVASKGDVQFVNDSAATVPEAALAAVTSFDRPVHLICGGADKDLEFAKFAEIASRSVGLYLLAGTATEAIVEILKAAGAPYSGPFDALEPAVSAARQRAEPGSVVLLSPGCASFGMFRNEFERGDQFREIVSGL